MIGTNDLAPTLSAKESRTGPWMPPPRAPPSARLPAIVTCVSETVLEPLAAIAPPPLHQPPPSATLPVNVEFSTVSAPRQMLMAPPRPASPLARFPVKVLRAMTARVSSS